MIEDEAMEEKIRGWIFDDKRTLDYKCLSEEFKIHVNVGKQHLFKLASSKWSSDLQIRYSLSGFNVDGIFFVRLVFDEDLEEAKKALESLTSLSVHSIALKGHYSLLSSTFKENSQSYSIRSSIRNKSVVVKASSILDKTEVKKEIKAEPSSNKSSQDEKPLTEIKTKVNSKAAPPNKKGLAGLWAKAAEKKAAEKENRINEQKEEAQLQTKASKPEKSSSSQTKKRKRVQVLSESESEEEEEENEEEEDALRTQESEVSSNRKMDSDTEDEIPATPTIQEPVSNKKRKVRKSVRKQYIDEEGYMLTRNEFEYQSEEEEEEQHEASTTKSVISKPEKSPKKSKDPTPPHKNKQASITNFFKKK